MNILARYVSIVKKVHIDLLKQIHFFGIRFALYEYIWWINFYIRTPVAWKLSSWAMRKKTVWLDSYLQSKYHNVFSRSWEIREKTVSEKPPRIIWFFWGQGEDKMPELISACYQQLKNNNQNVKLLTLENYKEYVDIPNSIISRVRDGSLSWAFFSDILRTSLLACHGGLWLDATVWVPSRIPWEKLETFSFYSANGQISKSRKSMCFWTSLECNWSGWCMYARQKGYPLFQFTSSLLTEIALGEKYLPDYVIVDYAIYTAYRNNPQVKQDMQLITCLPCTNRNTLANWMNHPYDESEYKSLIANDFVFKLSFRSPWHSTASNGQESFYGHLISFHNGIR